MSGPYAEPLTPSGIEFATEFMTQHVRSLPGNPDHFPPPYDHAVWKRETVASVITIATAVCQEASGQIAPIRKTLKHHIDRIKQQDPVVGEQLTELSAHLLTLTGLELV